MLLDELPEELLLQSLALLDYSSLASLSSTNRFFHYLTQDHTLWRAVYERTFSPSRRTPSTNEWRASCAARIENLRGFLVRGSNNYHAASARTIFTEMGPENGALLVHLLERSDYTMDSLLVQCQGFAVSNARRLLPRLPAPAALTKLVAMLRERLQEDPRSQTFLLRMLLARHTGHIMSVDAVETFLRCSHLVVYKSIDHPLWFFPPRIKRVVSQRDRRSLRSNRTYGQSATSQEIEAEEGEEIGPVINWGVVETISSMIKLYRDHLSDAIPGFSKSRDDYEYEVPMCSSMFDADLSGNWRGLYGYLDFREFDALDATRAFSPDFFDGIQSLKISSEHAFASSDHPLEHNEEDGTPEVLPESPYSDIASDTESRQSELGAKQSEMNIQRQRFIAEGSSIHGEFHVHGSTMRKHNLYPLNIGECSPARNPQYGARLQGRSI